MTCRSWKVVDKADGELQFVLIAGLHLSQSDINSLIQKGMKCVVIDERSALVNKKLVDIDIMPD
jgi:hypothetical protein